MQSLPPPIPAVSRRLSALVLAAALASGGTGCADDAPPTRARDGRVSLTLDDFSIAPQRVRAKPGRITLTAVNRGAVGHTLRVRRGDQELVAIKTLLPGASGTAAGRLERGTYDLVCILGNHEELGMYGTLTVR
jgi:plastocyanin